MLASLVAAGPTAQGQDSNAQTRLKTDLTNILERQAVEWNKRNLEGFMSAYWKSDQLTFSAGGNTTRGWEATLERYKKTYGGKPDMGELHFSDLEVTLLGPDAALMLGHWHLNAKDQSSEGNFSLVWRKIDNQWKIIHDHSSSLEPEKNTDAKTEATKPGKTH
jgi:beta-aspartyl-peptidase (threonine type)